MTSDEQSLTVTSGGSSAEQLGQTVQHPLLRFPANGSKTFHESTLVDRPELIEDDLPPYALKRAGNSRRVVAPFRGHWCNDHRSNVCVHLVRRNDETRSGFSDFAPSRRIEIDQKDIETANGIVYSHTHSESIQSARAAPGSRSLSSPRSAILAKASPQPSRTR